MEQTFSFQNEFINQYKNAHFNDGTIVYRQISWNEHRSLTLFFSVCYENLNQRHCSIVQINGSNAAFAMISLLKAKYPFQICLMHLFFALCNNSSVTKAQSLDAFKVSSDQRVKPTL